MPPWHAVAAARDARDAEAEGDCVAAWLRGCAFTGSSTCATNTLRPTSAWQQRMHDIPFNAATDEVVFTPRIGTIRAQGASTARVQLLAVDHQSERLIGEYTFIHTPWHGG